MATIRKFKMAAVTILNFAKSEILGHSNHSVATIYQCTKYDQNIIIYYRDMVKNRKFNMAAAAFLSFALSGIFST